jgi:hypothetical protein
MANREIFVSTTNPGKYVEQVDHGAVKSFRRSPFGKRWHKMAFECHTALAKSNITGSDYRVFHMIMPSIEDGAHVYVNQTQLGKELGMTASNVARSLRRLIEAGVIRKIVSASGRLYMLNPNFAWYGADNGDHSQAVKDWAVN